MRSRNVQNRKFIWEILQHFLDVLVGICEEKKHVCQVKNIQDGIMGSAVGGINISEPLQWSESRSEPKTPDVSCHIARLLELGRRWISELANQ